MTRDEKIIRNKVGVLELAKQLGSVSQACRIMGFSRDSFYRFKDLYEKGGEAALIEMSRRVPNPKNRVAETVERRILELAVEQPAWGHTRMANELAKEGLRVSPTGVRGVMANPDAADAGGGDAQALLGQLVGHSRVSPGRLLHRQLEDAPLHRLGHPVLRVRHPARHFDQRRLTALFIQILEPIKAVAGKPHDPARLADAAELLRQLQHADLVTDDLLVPRHRVVSSLRYSMSTLGDDTPAIAACQI